MMGLFENDGKKLHSFQMFSQGLGHHFPHFNGLKWGSIYPSSEAMLEAMLEDGLNAAWNGLEWLGTPNLSLESWMMLDGYPVRTSCQTTMIDNGRFNGAKAYKDSKAGDLDQICRYWIDLRDNETIVFTPLFFGFVYIAL